MMLEERDWRTTECECSNGTGMKEMWMDILVESSVKVADSTHPSGSKSFQHSENLKTSVIPSPEIRLRNISCA